MRSNEFKTYHPLVNFTYYLFTIGFSMFFMHPFCLIVSFISSLLHLLIVFGGSKVKKNLLYIIPVMLFTAVINPAFNHKGVTIITYLPGGNPLTAESIVYGFAAATMLAGVLLRFSVFNEIMTSDKIMYLFGRILSALSMIFSMTLSFIPKFSARFKKVCESQKSMGRGISDSGFVQRVKRTAAVLSIMVTWALESGVETADSMKSRGYGLPGRTAFSLFRFDKRDGAMLFVVLSLVVCVFAGVLNGKTSYDYYPMMRGAECSVMLIVSMTAYTTLCFLPVFAETWEVFKWNGIKNNIK